MISTLAKVTLPELTEAWNRCWQGYYYNMHYEQEHMKAWLSIGNIDLSHSAALCHEEKIIGFSLLSIYGKEGWVAGACIDPGYRGKKLFPQLMSEQIRLAKLVGLDRLYLEVFEQNHVALKVYEKVGFKKIRRLNCYKVQFADLNTEHMIRLSAKNGDEEELFYPVSPELYFKVREEGEFKPAWQRRENFLMHYPNLSAYLSKNHVSGYLVGGKHKILLDAWSNSYFESQIIISNIIEQFNTFTINNQPEQDQINQFFLFNKIKCSDCQLEMVINLK